MSSQTNNVILTLRFSDDDERIYTFNNVSDSDLDDIKDKIKAINKNENNEYENFYKTFVSRDGEPVESISECKIVSIEEEVIYSG